MFNINIIQTVVPMAARPTMAAAMASILSIVLMLDAAAAGLAGAGRCAAGAAAGAAAAERWAAGVADERKVVELGGVGTSEGPPGALAAPVGPPGGRVGNLIVGAAVGLGGKLIRTVSFLG